MLLPRAHHGSQCLHQGPHGRPDPRRAAFGVLEVGLHLCRAGGREVPAWLPGSAEFPVDLHMGGFLEWGSSTSWMVYDGKSH